MTTQTQLDALAEQTFDLLQRTKHVLVTAESCTAGLIAATLARIPGMSNCFAGSFVVYQVASKIEWLDIPEETITRCDVVSREVAETMAVQSLSRTLHATISLSVTGHLGPDAPKQLDGIAWLATARRERGVRTQQLRLRSGTVADASVDSALRIRRERQQDAVAQCLSFLIRQLAESA